MQHRDITRASHKQWLMVSMLTSYWMISWSFQLLFEANLLRKERLSMELFGTPTEAMEVHEFYNDAINSTDGMTWTDFIQWEDNKAPLFETPSPACTDISASLPPPVTSSCSSILLFWMPLQNLGTFSKSPYYLRKCKVGGQFIDSSPSEMSVWFWDFGFLWQRLSRRSIFDFESPKRGDRPWCSTKGTWCPNLMSQLQPIKTL